MNRRRIVAAVALLAGILVTPASAQFNTAFNHLKCYKINGDAFLTNLIVDNQFGRERIFKLKPVLLCAPTRKICCQGQATSTHDTTCVQIPCPPDHSLNQPAPVDHFKCYKILPKDCIGFNTTVATDCPAVGKFVKNFFAVDLTDQFHTEPNVAVGAPQILCAPVLKVVVRPSTTTTVTTIQTTTTTTTTTTLPCRDVAQPGQPPMCAGTCPPGSGLECVFIPSNSQCTCEIPCAPQGPVPQTCNNQFCPNAGQQCIPNATSPCSCCYPPGFPCTAGSDCCSGACNAATLACQ